MWSWHFKRKLSPNEPILTFIAWSFVNKHLQIYNRLLFWLSQLEEITNSLFFSFPLMFPFFSNPFFDSAIFSFSLFLLYWLLAFLYLSSSLSTHHPPPLFPTFLLLISPLPTPQLVFPNSQHFFFSSSLEHYTYSSHYLLLLFPLLSFVNLFPFLSSALYLLFSLLSPFL